VSACENGGLSAARRRALLLSWGQTLTCDRERGKSANLGCVASLSQGPHSGKKVKSQLVVYQRVILTSDRSACHQQYRAHLPRLTASINAIDSGLK
jgi:hypothetical protein